MAKFSPLLLLLALLAVLAAKAASSPVDLGDESEYEEDYPGDSNDHFDEEEEEEETYNGPPPVIHTKAEEFKERPGATALLPCNVSNSDPNVVVMWKKGPGTPLFSDSIKMTFDKRLERHEDNSLEIRNLNAKDSGEYYCELSTPDKMHIIHILHVYAEPTIVDVYPGPNKIIRKGDSLTIKCEVEGYPEPVITWSKKGKRLPTGEATKVANSITFQPVERNHNGTYECKAENGYGKPAVATIDVRVQYAPEIKIDKESVNTAEGYTSEITCTVHAEPKAKVIWYKEGLLLAPSDRITESRIGNHHTLRIKNTNDEDFGTYTCFANNSIGRNQQVMKLSGVPSRAQFDSDSPKMQNGHAQVLKWTVESNSPITEYKLMYRKKNTTEMKIGKPEVVNPDGNVYTVIAELSDLGEGVYEATLLSKNQYGWSSESDWQSFPGMDYQKTEPQAKTISQEEPLLEESSGSGVEGLRPNILAALLIALMAYFHV
ncbi:lachesin-like isoform X2 [Hetaerina americana]|uniref:lachesin-like isoform X2 n=1 Tax=Hetaerina americana TaxID=62018 RepID=UPI003A7F308E